MLKVLVFAFMLSVVSSAAHAESNLTQASDDLAIASWGMAELRHQVALSGALIRSSEDLSAHLAEFKEGASPLDLLSHDARNEFLTSLQFGSRGVASLNPSALERELTATQTYAVLELFGWQELTWQLSYEKSKTELDLQFQQPCGDGIFGNTCPDGPYVKGVCLHQGTCQLDDCCACHPPSC